MGHTVKGVMPRETGEVAEKPCIWCGSPTDLRFMPGARPELGPQPMHMLCTADMTLCFEALERGDQLNGRWIDRMKRFDHATRLALSPSQPAIAAAASSAPPDSG